MRLASTSRSLRKVLVSRSGRIFWTTVRNRDGYDLLDDLGEIDFALLLFGSNCQVCLLASLFFAAPIDSSRSNQICGTSYAVFYSPVRIRTCDDCSKEQYVRSWEPSATESDTAYTLQPARIQACQEGDAVSALPGGGRLLLFSS